MDTVKGWEPAGRAELTGALFFTQFSLSLTRKVRSGQVMRVTQAPEQISSITRPGADGLSSNPAILAKCHVLY